MSSGWERDLNRAVQAGLKEMTRDLQRVVDRVHRQYAGKPVATVKPALKRALASAKVTLSDKELTGYAQAISDGTRIRFTTK